MKYVFREFEYVTSYAVHYYEIIKGYLYIRDTDTPIKYVGNSFTVEK